jgi:DNA-binding LytR/AlgR family response regulator
VFVTTHVEHVVVAFEKCTADYVLKPFDRTDQRSLGPRLSENGGRARRKIDRSLAAIAETILSSAVHEDGNQN